VDDYKFFTVDDEARPRIILPYFYEGRIVGNTSRFYDGRRPKYLSEQQKGYVFNIDAQHADWSVCILTEGQFDALSIGGCAYMGSNISDDQARLLSKLRRRIIVVPDQDEAGLEICDRTLELGYQVSIPNWGDEIKDVNDAVVKYGRLPTLLSILQCATSSKIKIGMARKRFK
jgi:DNA primase